MQESDRRTGDGVGLERATAVDDNVPLPKPNQTPSTPFFCGAVEAIIFFQAARVRGSGWRDVVGAVTSVREIRGR